MANRRLLIVPRIPASLHVAVTISNSIGILSMTIDAQVSAEPLVRLSAAPAIVERIGGERVHKSAIYRWTQRGLRGVRLRTTFAGGHRRTCETWIREFFEAVTQAADGGNSLPSEPSSRQQRRRAAEIARADAELRKDGI